MTTTRAICGFGGGLMDSNGQIGQNLSDATLTNATTVTATCYLAAGTKYVRWNVNELF